MPSVVSSAAPWAVRAALPDACIMLSRAALLLSSRGRQLSGSAVGGTGSVPAAEQLGSIPLSFPALCIWGSNTGVGKTLFSAGLAAACRRAGLSVLYLKPAQTGFPGDSDARLVSAAAALPLAVGPHAAHLTEQADGAGAGGGAGSSHSLAGLSKTLYAWRQAVSPHLAVEREGRHVSDRQLAAATAAELRLFADSNSMGAGRLAIVETAGGVASPGPSGTLQSDLLRPLRLPGLLVGDGRLGGISATLSSYDALALRGHQVPLVALMDDYQLANTAAIQRHLRGKAEVLAFPVCQPPPAAAAAEPQLIDASLAAWLEESALQFDRLLQLAAEAHEQRLAKLQASACEARRMLWWPFTQHASVDGDSGVTVIDGRVGECFAVFTPGEPGVPAADGSAAGTATSPWAGSSNGGSLQLMYDGCASWWTQGVSQAAQPELVRALSTAAARYGHVMFPENAHEPALELAKGLLGTVGRGWASRVFYSDDGSTAIEVALKMAFRKYMADHGLLEGGAQLEVLGLQEAYHGDTLGAMEAVAPSPFNGRLQTPWYSGRGLFLDPPVVALQAGVWRVQLPADMQAAAADAAALAARVVPGSRLKPWALEFGSQADVFAVEKRMQLPGQQQEQQAGGTASLYHFYRQYIEQQLEQYGQQGQQPGEQPRRQLGACLLEPVLQGAGGMRLIDPLYQRALVDACRARRVPVILDEVFTGFWRLGATGGAALLGSHPDIACYAKLLTGGTVPLSATLAREEVFEAFQGDSKFMALLHGHSYTAHPIGCGVGVEALRLYRDPEINPNWCTPEVPGRCQVQQQQAGSNTSSSSTCGCAAPCGRLLPLWDEAAVAALSRHPSVRGVTPLGTVLAVQLRAEDGSGYASNAAAAVVHKLRKAGVFGRPLGDVVYLMVTPMTERRQCDELLAKLTAALG